MGKPTTKATKFKYYAVATGRQPGIYDSWALAEQQIASFSNALFKGFNTTKSAEKFMHAGKVDQPKYYIALEASHTGGTDTAPASPSQNADDNLNATYNSEFDNEFDMDADTVTVRVNDNDKSTPVSTKPRPAAAGHKPNSTNQCTNCVRLEQVVDMLTDKLANLESLIVNQNNANQFKLAELASKVAHLQQRHDVDASKQQPREQMSLRTPQSDRQPAHPTDGGMRKPTDYSKPAPKKPKQVDFAPEKCIVIDDLTPESAKSLNQDKIRRTISQSFGPVMIDMINRYKPNTARPKYIVQFADSAVINNILDNWKPDTLQGASVRKTVAPTPTNCVGMARGIPLDLPDKDLGDAVNDAFPGCSFYRMKTREGNLLRTVKLKFPTPDLLTQAVHDGLRIQHQQLLLRVEYPYSRNSNSSSSSNA